MQNANEIQKKIEELEAEMLLGNFWDDKNKAQMVVKELAELKEEKSNLNKYDKGNAVINIISGAGGTGAAAGAYDTAANRDILINLVNEMRQVLITAGLMKGS